MILRMRPGADNKKAQAVVEEWYREQIRGAALPLIAKWEPVMGVKVARFFVRHMKTRWGSCTPHRRSIRLNTELAKKPPQLLEYIVVHELAHLIVRGHNDRFTSILGQAPAPLAPASTGAEFGAAQARELEILRKRRQSCRSTLQTRSPALYQTLDSCPTEPRCGPCGPKDGRYGDPRLPRLCGRLNALISARLTDPGLNGNYQLPCR